MHIEHLCVEHRTLTPYSVGKLLLLDIGFLILSAWSTAQVGRRLESVELVLFLVQLAMRDPKEIAPDEGKNSDEPIVPHKEGIGR